ncbi:MAG: elongation factor P [Alphaproteobacteria bacterium]|nr:elongation factor P [Alphaproteobacteria bacterium]
MKVQANTLRAGNVVEIDGKLLVVIKSQIITPGKGGAFVQVEMKGIRDGVKKDERYRTGETVERAQLEDHEYQYLYGDGDTYTFMDQQNFEQITVSKAVIGEPARWLQENMVCNIRTYEGQAMTVELPQTVTLEIVEAEPAVKGQTASSSYKAAKLSNGEKIMVPVHIGPGTRVVVSTEDGTYRERAKD